ncbi:MAG: hypothetical protein AAF543_05685 [Pseudomonadota bacterium]
MKGPLDRLTKIIRASLEADKENSPKKLVEDDDLARREQSHLEDDMPTKD